MFDPVTEYTPYAGIGSRETPPDILELMTAISRMLDERGYTLRSGGAEGADQAFDWGTSGMSHPEVFLPWEGFNGKRSTIDVPANCVAKAMEIAREFHPNWAACSDGARKLHTRNTFQVLGRDLVSPSKFIVCWTKDGKASGGTGQALRIADSRKIPIHNLHSKETRGRFYGELGWDHAG